jgi:hypothetical protein
MKTEIIKEKRNNIYKILMAVGALLLIGAFAFGVFQLFKPEANTPRSLAKEQPRGNVPEKAKPITTALNIPPRALADAGEFAENVYDFAKAKDWTKAEEKQTALEKAVGELKAENLATSELIKTTDLLAKFVKARNEIDAMREANEATFLVAEQTAKFNPKVPVEVTKLDYYGRAIEVWAAAKDETKLRITAEAIRQTWNAVKPKIEAKGGAAEAARFESLVGRAEKAKSATEFAGVATPILDEVDNLEKVFG